MIDRTFFFAQIRPLFDGRMTQDQVDGCNAILTEWDRRGLTDMRHLAYMLATTYHETAHTMQPIREFGRGKGKKYGTTFYGRGYVQLTWRANYRRMGEILGISLETKPDLALDETIAAQILFEGMLRAESFKGDFTGKSLEDYFNATADDPVNARRIINGTDKAGLIAGYHNRFLSALRGRDAAPPPVPEPGFWTRLWRWIIGANS